MGNITKNYYGHSQSHDIEVNVSMSVDEILELQRRSAQGMSDGTEIKDAEVREIRELPKELKIERALAVMDKMFLSGFLDEYYMPLAKYSLTDKAIIAGIISQEVWSGENKWKPFEEYWQVKNLSTLYSQGMKQQKSGELLRDLNIALK